MKIEKLINFIYPASCYICENKIEQKGLCLECFSKIKFGSVNSCKVCGFKIEIEEQDICLICIDKKRNFDSVSYVFEYNEIISNLVNQFKYYDNTNMRYYLQKFLNNILKKQKQDKNIDIIIPVPISLLKLYKRKYNHISFLAKDIAKRNKLKYNPLVLKKIKNTKDQRGLDLKHRLNNLKNVFVIDKNKDYIIKDKNVLLLDDIITTGTTINECSKVLKKGGAKEVHILALARVNGSLKV